MAKKHSPVGGEIPCPGRNTKHKAKNNVAKRSSGERDADLGSDLLNGLHLASLFIWGIIFLSLGAVAEVSVGLHLAKKEWSEIEMQIDSSRVQPTAQSEAEEHRDGQLRVAPDGSLIPTHTPTPLKADIHRSVCGCVRSTFRDKKVVSVDQ